MKRGEMERYKAPIELELMRRLKQTLDPQGILNPGKVV
jgi:FAD/FMN-containing dehydrogenase